MSLTDQKQGSPSFDPAEAFAQVEYADSSDEEFVIKTKNWVIQHDHPAKMLWNSVLLILVLIQATVLPFTLAFSGETIRTLNLLSSVLFVLDIVLASRTTYFHRETGERVQLPKEICKHYWCSFGFLVDLTAALPLWAMDRMECLALFQLLKLARLQRPKIWSTSSDLALTFKITNLMAFLFLYIHATACVHFAVANKDQLWQPAEASRLLEEMEVDFYSANTRLKYLISLNSSLLMLTGNEIIPESELHILVQAVFSLLGALVIANIFGNIAAVVSAQNRKAELFQEKVDLANTSMTNMKLPVGIKKEVRNFMLSTQQGLDCQKELDTFMAMVSPSIKNKVTKHIFLNAISANPVFSSCSQQALDYMISDVTTLLSLPEEKIISQGAEGDCMFMIARGQCQVYVSDLNKRQVLVNALQQGDYFGEISLLYNSVRTATVKTSNYCTLSQLSRATLLELGFYFPEIVGKMKDRSLKYKDPWKKFKMSLLREIDYLEEAEKENEDLLDEVQHYMQERVFEKGHELATQKTKPDHIVFVVEGLIELRVFDADSNYEPLSVLKPGDSFGLYSVLFDEPLPFSAITMTQSARVLLLPQKFFMEYKDSIEHLETAIRFAEERVEAMGMPQIDVAQTHFFDDFKWLVRRTMAKKRVLEGATRPQEEEHEKQDKSKKISIVEEQIEEQIVEERKALKSKGRRPFSKLSTKSGFLKFTKAKTREANIIHDDNRKSLKSVSRLSVARGFHFKSPTRQISRSKANSISSSRASNRVSLDMIKQDLHDLKQLISLSHQKERRSSMFKSKVRLQKLKKYEGEEMSSSSEFSSESDIRIRSQSSASIQVSRRGSIVDRERRHSKIRNRSIKKRNTSELQVLTNSLNEEKKKIQSTSKGMSPLLERFKSQDKSIYVLQEAPVEESLDDEGEERQQLHEIISIDQQESEVGPSNRFKTPETQQAAIPRDFPNEVPVFGGMSSSEPRKKQPSSNTIVKRQEGSFGCRPQQFNTSSLFYFRSPIVDQQLPFSKTSYFEGQKIGETKQTKSSRKKNSLTYSSCEFDSPNEDGHF